jgi:ubiquinone/menaquinone biosynthesis C-methylase UbiE
MSRPTPASKTGVPEAFDAVALGYDRLVGANPGYHQHLRLSALRLGVPNRGEGLRLLDVGCGTGASTAALLSVAPKATIVGADGSAGMIARARAKNWPPSVTFVHTRLEELAGVGAGGVGADGVGAGGVGAAGVDAGGVDAGRVGAGEADAGRVGAGGVGAGGVGTAAAGPFDGILAAYLVRNLPDPDAGLRTLLGLLRPGARLAVHDYSVADSLRARAIWNAVCWTVIIPSGALVTRRAGLYRYLWESVRDFDGAAAFQLRLGRAGFDDLSVHTMPGWQRDVVHTFLARRAT